MKAKHIQQASIVFLSFVFGLLLVILPLPPFVEWFRPQWMLLILIFWVKMLPRSVGLCVGWFAGLFVDAVQGSVIGQYGVVFLVVAFLVNFTRSRMRHCSYQKQLWWVLSVIGVGQLVLLSIEFAVGQPSTWIWYVLSCLASVVAWPLVSALLSKCHRFAWRNL